MDASSLTGDMATLKLESGKSMPSLRKYFQMLRAQLPVAPPLEPPPAAKPGTTPAAKPGAVTPQDPKKK